MKRAMNEFTTTELRTIFTALNGANFAGKRPNPVSQWTAVKKVRKAIWERGSKSLLLKRNLA